jgi:hypothetical protein
MAVVILPLLGLDSHNRWTIKRGPGQLDADVFACDMITVVPPNEEYPAFWRSMTRLAHKISQNNLAVVFFSVTLPQQLLANTEVLDYFESVSFLCLTSDAGLL